MAARLNPRNAEAVRQRIQTTQLVKRVQSHALGELDMKPSELDAAKFLINKRMPNPPEKREHEHSGSVTVEIVRFGDDDSAAE